MSLKNLNLMIYHADLQPARGIISRAFFCEKTKKRLQTKALEMTYGRAVYPSISGTPKSASGTPFLTSYAENNIPQNYVEKQE